MPAAEALENLPRRIDIKRGRLLLLKRTQRLELRAAALERNISTDHIDNVHGLAHLLDDFRWNHAGHAVSVAYRVPTLSCAELLREIPLVGGCHQECHPTTFPLDLRGECQRGESNPRPRAYESPALPLSYPG
jgi:hypothetical protein